jgi:hypothetical protein
MSPNAAEEGALLTDLGYVPYIYRQGRLHADRLDCKNVSSSRGDERAGRAAARGITDPPAGGMPFSVLRGMTRPIRMPIRASPTPTATRTHRIDADSTPQRIPVSSRHPSFAG